MPTVRLSREPALAVSALASACVRCLVHLTCCRACASPRVFARTRRDTCAQPSRTRGSRAAVFRRATRCCRTHHVRHLERFVRIKCFACARARVQGARARTAVMCARLRARTQSFVALACARSCLDARAYARAEGARALRSFLLGRACLRARRGRARVRARRRRACARVSRACTGVLFAVCIGPWPSGRCALACACSV
eukprot:5005680-Pleurochrysis_carterae.AAC.1